MGIDYSARLFGIVFSDIRLEFLERHTYIHHHRALCEYGAIKNLYFTVNRSALESISTQHNAELEQAREQASGGGALTEECRRRVEEVERLLRENTEVRHDALLSVGWMTVCMYVCVSGDGGGGLTEECRRRVEEVERLLLGNTEVRYVVLLHVGRMNVCLYVCMSVSQLSGGEALTGECRRRVEEVERLLRENTEVRHDALLSLMLDVCLCRSPSAFLRLSVFYPSPVRWLSLCPSVRLSVRPTSSFPSDCNFFQMLVNTNGWGISTWNRQAV